MKDLEYKLLTEIGLGVDPDHNIVDQDYGTIVYLNGKLIKANANGVEPFVNRHDVYFDPIGNVKLMRNLFQYYMTKLNRLENKYFPVFFPVYREHGLGGFEVKNDIENYKSGFYYNESLRYIDLIFKLSGDEIVDLREYDFKVR